MGPLDTRLWSLVPSALLLAGACQTGVDIPSDGDEAPDGACEPACKPNQFCVDGEYCYTIPPDPECGADSDCLPGSICEPLAYGDAECAASGFLIECSKPALIEIPLPDEAQGQILDLEFVDLDGDGIDELVLLQPGTLLVVSHDQTVTSAAVDPLSTVFVAVRANDDQHLDVVTFGATPDHTGLLLGHGDRSFAPASSLALPVLLNPHAVDWPNDGAQGLVGLDGEGLPVFVSQLAADAPVIAALPVHSFAGGAFDDIHVTDANQDGVDEFLLRRSCLVGYQTMLNQIVMVGDYGDDVSCRSYVEPFGASARDQLVILASIGADTGLRMFSDVGTSNQTTQVPGAVTELAGVAGLGMVFVGPLGAYLIRSSGQHALHCGSVLDDLPLATRVIAGAFNGSPGDEFVLLGHDQLSMWARP